MTTQLDKVLTLGVDILNCAEEVMAHPANVFEDIADLVPVLGELKDLNLNAPALLAEVEGLSDADVQEIASRLDQETVLPNHASIGLFVKQVVVLVAKLDELIVEVVKLVKGG